MSKVIEMTSPTTEGSEVERVVMCGAGCGCEFDSQYVNNRFYESTDKSGCPKCGCEKVTSVGNTQAHPDNWTQWNCLNCNHLIAEIDNSPMAFCWEFESDTFEW
jgi:hypothetical protein